MLARTREEQQLSKVGMDGTKTVQQQSKLEEVVIMDQQQQSTECALLPLLTRTEQSSTDSGEGKQPCDDGNEVMLARTRKDQQQGKVAVDVTEAERFAMDGTKAAQQQKKLEEPVVMGQQQQSTERALLLMLASTKQSSTDSGKGKQLSMNATEGKLAINGIEEIIKKLKTEAKMGKGDQGVYQGAQDQDGPAHDGAPKDRAAAEQDQGRRDEGQGNRKEAWDEREQADLGQRQTWGLLHGPDLGAHRPQVGRMFHSSRNLNRHCKSVVLPDKLTRPNQTPAWPHNKPSRRLIVQQ